MASSSTIFFLASASDKSFYNLATFSFKSLTFSLTIARSLVLISTVSSASFKESYKGLTSL